MGSTSNKVVRRRVVSTDAPIAALPSDLGKQLVTLPD
jgi:hypothetical protein